MKLKLDFFEQIYLSVKTWFRATQWLRVLGIGLTTTTAALAIFVLAGSLVEASSVFTVSFTPGDGGPGSSGAQISLSETKDFADPKTALDAGGMENMTNISVRWLPDGLDRQDGSHNGDNYIAYTFYVKNVGNKPCTLHEEILLDSSLMNADAAIRIRVYRQGVSTTYAKLGANGLPEVGTTPFFSDSVISSEVVPDFAPGTLMKYTLVIWLEGDDPECLDNIRGGNVKMSMSLFAEESPPD